MYTVLTTRMVRKIARRPMRDDGSDKELLYRGFALLYKARRELPTKDEMEYANRIIDSKWAKFDCIEDYPSKEEWEWQIH